MWGEVRIRRGFEGDDGPLGEETEEGGKENVRLFVGKLGVTKGRGVLL